MNKIKKMAMWTVFVSVLFMVGVGIANVYSQQKNVKDMSTEELIKEKSKLEAEMVNIVSEEKTRSAIQEQAISVREILLLLYHRMVVDYVFLIVQLITLMVAIWGLRFAYKELNLKTDSKDKSRKKFLIWKLLVDKKQFSVHGDTLFDEYNKNNSSNKIKIKDDFNLILYEMLKEGTIVKMSDYFLAMENPHQEDPLL